jgi:hypothetical protein
MDERDLSDQQTRLTALEQALTQPPRFRAESRDRPLAYGYIRSATRRLPYIQACRRTLERYCRKEKLWLCAVFVDHGIPADMIVRPGLIGLCDVLRLPDSFAAITVNAEHLSDDNQIAKLLVEQVRATGARMLFVRSRRRAADTSNMDSGPNISAIPGSGACVSLPEWWQ